MNELKRVKITFILTLFVSFLSMIVVVKSINDGPAWRMISSTIAFACIMSMVTLLFHRIIKLLKLAKERR